MIYQIVSGQLTNIGHISHILSGGHIIYFRILQMVKEKEEKSKRSTIQHLFNIYTRNGVHSRETQDPNEEGSTQEAKTWSFI